MKIKQLSVLLIVATVALFDISVSHAQSNVFTQNLYYGLQGNSQVTQLQEFLTSQNLYSGPITGNFYFLTLGAVKAFQTQQGITPAAGYFGPITMAAANKIADAEVSASNNEAITETGTSTPPTIQTSSTAQLELNTLLQELAVLEQQLQTQQSSTQVLQQIASNTQSIATVIPQPNQSSAPVAEITANGSVNSITIPSGTATTITWSSSNANSCSVSPSGWSGESGSESTGNLTASRTYIVSCSGAGGSASANVTVNVSTLPTTPTPVSTGTNPPVITNVQATNITGNAATITWTTNEYANGEVYFGTASGDYSAPVSNSGTVSSNGSYVHSVSLSSLNFNTTYYYKAASTDDSGNEGVSSEYTFTTQAAPVGTLTATENTAVGSQVVSTISNSEIGSYALTASSVEGVNVNSVNIQTSGNSNGSGSPFQNLEVMVNGSQFGSTQSTVSSGTIYTFSGTPFTIPAGGTVDVNVYANISSSTPASTVISLATILTGVSGAGAVSSGALAITNPVSGQTISIAGGGSINVETNNGSNPTAGPVIMGTMGNTLAAFNFQETTNVENVKVTQLDVVDVTTAANPSFSNLTLWNGAIQIGGAAQYLGPSTANGQNAFVYQFSLGNNSSFIIPRNGTLPVNLKGSVNTFVQGNVTDGSIHTFEVATSALAPTATSTVIAIGTYSNQAIKVVLSSAAGNPQTVLRNAMTFSSSQVGLTSGRSKSTTDQLATLTFTPYNNGSVALNTIQVAFSGSAMSSNASVANAFASSTYLVVGQYGSFGTQYSPTSWTCNGGSCTVIYSWPTSIGGYPINGSPATFTLVANTSQNTVIGGPNQSVSLFATIAAPSSILYTDGTDSSATTISNIGLPSSVETPVQVFGTMFATNS